MSQFAQFQEIKKFICAPQAHVRLEAVKILASCSTNEQMQPFYTSLEFSKDLISLLLDTNEETCRYSCITLINLTANPNFLANFVKQSPFNNIVKKLTAQSAIDEASKDKSKKALKDNKGKKGNELEQFIESMSLTELLLQVLVNATREEQGRNNFLLIDQPTRRGLYLLRLIFLLKSVNFDNKHCIKAYAYLPYILCNLTQSFDGRQLLVEPKRNLLKYVIPFMNNYQIIDNMSENDEYYEYYQLFIHGIWDTIKNVCFGLDDSPNVLLSVLTKSQSSQTNDKNEKLCKDDNNDDTKENSENNENNDGLSDNDKSIILKYFMNVFCNMDDVNDEIEESKENNNNNNSLMDNNFIFEIICPIVGALHEYDSKSMKLRYKVEKCNKWKKENQNGIDKSELNGKYKLNKFDKILERYMKYDKMRCDDIEIRKKCLECIHLIVGVTDRYGLEKQLPVFLNKYVYLEAILENYQKWEYGKELIDLTDQIIKTLKWQLKDRKDETEEVKNEEASNDNENERDNKNEKKENDEASQGMDIAPMQQNFGVYPKKDVRTYNKEEASALFDLFEQNQNN